MGEDCRAEDEELPEQADNWRSRLFEWLCNNWLGHHLALIPLGTLLTAWLLLGAVGGGWSWWSSASTLAAIGQAAPFAAAVYGAAVLPIEAGVRLMFWAISEVLKERKRWQDALAAAQAEAAKAREEQESTRAEGREEGRESRDEELRKQAEETGEIMVNGKRFRVVAEDGAPSNGNGHWEEGALRSNRLSAFSSAGGWAGY